LRFIIIIGRLLERWREAVSPAVWPARFNLAPVRIPSF
jgi:hypothetical protein